jgi:NADPH-dependent glutamate synthase beta subunit-like oxidoreductase
MKITAEKVVCVGGGDTSIDVVSVARRLGHITKTGPKDLPETVIHDGYVAHDAAMTAAAEGAEVTLTSLFTRDKMTASEHEVHDATHEGVTILDGVMPLEVMQGRERARHRPAGRRLPDDRRPSDACRRHRARARRGSDRRGDRPGRRPLGLEASTTAAA